jgi:MFS family permease
VEHEPVSEGELKADRPAKTAHPWVAPLLLTVGVQAVAAFLSRLPPTVAPILTAERSIDSSTIGYLSAINTVGAMVFLLAGAPLMERVGSVRTLQIGLVLGGLGVIMMALPSALVLLPAVALMGLGYGPSTPAGSDILHRYVPKNRQALVFSIKQAGVPIGGVLAGFILPPLVDLGGLPLCLGVSAVIAVLCAIVVQPMRRRLDPLDRGGPPLKIAHFFAPENLSRPIRCLRDTPGLVRLAMTGLALALSQGIWIAFLVTVLVEQGKLSLLAAGSLFGVMQVAGVIGRIGLGWVADRVGSSTATLQVTAGLSAVCTACLAYVGADTSSFLLTLLSAIAGATVTGWNGVQIAEVARLSRPGEIRETAAGATLLLFSSYVIGPAAFALIAQLLGSYLLPLLGVAAITALSAFIPRSGLRRPAS